MLKKDPLAAAMALLAEAGKADEVDTSKIIVGGYDYRNNDAVAVFANLPAHFRPGICKNCKRPFAVNKRSVGFCSDLCRREDWRKTTGLEWGAVSTHDVWYGDPPMIVTPDQFAKLKAIAEWFTQNQTTLDIASGETTGEIQVQEVFEWSEDHYDETVETPQDNSLDNPLVHDLLKDQSRQVSDDWESLFGFRDSHTSPQPSPAPLVAEQTTEEADALFGF